MKRHGHSTSKRTAAYTTAVISTLSLSLLVTMTGCGGTSNGGNDDASTHDELNDTSNEQTLDDNAKRELTSVGFKEDEIKAVEDSISISKWLGVQSFVNEANEGRSAHESSVRRESHGKHQGCLRAKFDVKLPGNGGGAHTAGTSAGAGSVGVGVFENGASYPAWVRLSNGGAYQRDDKSPHVSRGIAIKLLGVQGTATGTHDFLMINSPRFFIHDVRHYPGFLKGSGNGRIGLVSNLLFNMSLEEQAVIAHRLRLKVSNLLEAPAYSSVPYAYGNETVKYAVAPCGAPPPTTPSSHPPPANAGENYLEDAMNATLSSSDPSKGVCFGFFIQRPRSEAADPIENPTQAWEGAFEQVATITIPYGQHEGGSSDYHANEAECERMAFEPWNTTSASHPVGKTNWMRKFVYAALNHFRRVEMPQVYAKWQANHDTPSIPKSWRDELAKLRNPSALAPKVKETNQPTIDEGFRKLGIVR